MISKKGYLKTPTIVKRMARGVPKRNEITDYHREKLTISEGTPHLCNFHSTICSEHEATGRCGEKWYCI